MPKPTRTPLVPVHPLTGLPLAPLGMSKRGLIWPIMGGDDTVPPADTPPPTPPAGQAAPATPPASGDQPPAGGTPEPKFTQADLDRIVGERIAKERKTFEQQMADLQATAGKTELEAERIKREQAEGKVTEVTKASAQRIAGTEAKLAAHLAGARPDRLDAILKQADLTEAVSETGEVDEAKVKAAIDKVIADYPEWKADTTPGLPGSSGPSMLPDGSGQKPVWTRQQLRDMPQAERVKRADELALAAAEGRIRG